MLNHVYLVITIAFPLLPSRSHSLALLLSLFPSLALSTISPQGLHKKRGRKRRI